MNTSQAHVPAQDRASELPAIPWTQAKADFSTSKVKLDEKAAAAERLRLEAEFPQAFDEGRFKLVYQPIVRLSDGAVTGFEALLRWDDRVRGMVPPAEFIPIAEETGLIIPLTAWMIAESCWRLSTWLAARNLGEPDFYMHINISGVCLTEPRLVPWLRNALAANDIPPYLLIVELTESAWVNLTCASRVLKQIRQLGVRVALDDFGTGYNSVGCVFRLPIDILKIDRSFVHRLGDEEHPEVLRAILELARELGMEVIAKGVETGTQLARLRSLGCEWAQGFLFSSPCPPDVAYELVHGMPSKPP